MEKVKTEISFEIGLDCHDKKLCISYPVNVSSVYDEQEDVLLKIARAIDGIISVAHCDFVDRSTDEWHRSC